MADIKHGGKKVGIGQNGGSLLVSLSAFGAPYPIIGQNTPMGQVDVLGWKLGEDQYATLIGARMIDFFNDLAPWQRRLWDVGTCMLLDEVVEAVDWRAKSVLSASALSWLANDTQRIVGRDPAAGDRVIKTQLRDALRATLTPGTRHVRLLNELSSLIQAGYLDRWQVQLSRSPSPERFARAISAHLLDHGYSMPFLHRWGENAYEGEVITWGAHGERRRACE